MSESSETVAAGGDSWFEALDWYTRLQEARETELPHDKIHAWQEWLAVDQNRIVFDQLSRLMEDGPHYRGRSLPSSVDIHSDRHEPTISVAAHRQVQQLARAPCAPARKFRRPRATNLLALAAAALVVVVGLLFLPQTGLRTDHPMGSPPQLYQTAIGEIRSIHLVDGSTVTLGAQSSIEVSFSAQRRSVRLGSGEAFFEVAHNAVQPFIVAAGTRTITAVGTAFVVHRDSDRVVVTVTEGSVEVVPKASADASPHTLSERLGTQSSLAKVRLARGQQISYGDTGTVRLAEHTDSEAVTAWSQGRLEFDHEPLRYVVEIVNRYSNRKIVTDELSGEHLYTGLVLRGQVDDWMHGLKNIFPVELIEQGEHVRVRSRDAAPQQGRAPCGTGH